MFRNKIRGRLMVLFLIPSNQHLIFFSPTCYFLFNSSFLVSFCYFHSLFLSSLISVFCCLSSISVYFSFCSYVFSFFPPPIFFCPLIRLSFFSLMFSLSLIVLQYQVLSFTLYDFSHTGGVALKRHCWSVGRPL